MKVEHFSEEEGDELGAIQTRVTELSETMKAEIISLEQAIAGGVLVVEG